MADDAYDAVVLGAGTGGYSAALRLAELGKRVAIVERDERLGGTCLIRGCIPSKALLESASVMEHINRSEEWGIKASGEVDWPKVLETETHIVDKKIQGLTGLIKARKIDVVKGTGTLVAGPAIRLEDGRTLKASDVVLASGSRPRLLPELELTERIITSDQALVLPRLPRSIVIIGAGAIGLEFATVFNAFGVKVTVVEALPRVAPLEDEDISREAARAFKKRGIETMVGVKVEGVNDTGGHVAVTVSSDGAGSKTLEADLCLVAIGRGPEQRGTRLRGSRGGPGAGVREGRRRPWPRPCPMCGRSATWPPRHCSWPIRPSWRA